MRLLIAPVTITPTKPLTPTHIKGFLWVDVLRKASRLVADVTCVWNPRTANLTGQSIGFWDYLDRVHAEVDFSQLDEIQIGTLYVAYHAETSSSTFDAAGSYRERIETTGWVHPATARMVDLWSRQLEELGVEDPGLRADHPHRWSVDELIDTLVARKLCLDHRGIGGPVYLDGTRWGVPLRIVVGSDGHPNYVITALRDILPLVDSHDHVLLVHDDDITPDFILLQKIIGYFGVTVSRLPLGRVPLAGQTVSSRRGGWAGSTLGELSVAARASVDQDAYRLGMRVYFTAMLGRSAGPSLDRAMLYRALTRSQRLLTPSERDAADPADYVRRHASKFGWVDPYRLTSSLLGGTPPARVLTNIFL